MSVYIAFAIGLALAASLAASAASRAISDTGDHAQGSEAPTPGQRLATSIGRLPAFIAVLLSGAVVTFLVCWPLGRLADHVESPIDTSVFHWAQSNAYGPWTSLHKILTQMGNGRETQVIVVVASVLLAIAWWRRGWWIPPLVLVSAFWAERLLQKALAHLVDRGHPPTTRGTFPSGGCARLILIWGVTLLLITFTWRLSRRVQVVLWTLLAVAAFVEGYARTYLLQHWFTDVIGGWVFGSLLLFTFALAVPALMSTKNHETGDASAAVPPESTRSSQAV